MDQHLCVVQTVDRNPFRTRPASRCQVKKRRIVKCGTSKCLVSYLVSLLLRRGPSSGHAPLLAEYQVSLSLIITRLNILQLISYIRVPTGVPPVSSLSYQTVGRSG